MKRREFGVSVGILSTAVLPSQVGGAQLCNRSGKAALIDQNPIRRRGTGLRVLDAARASAGLTLFAPATGEGMIYLVDLNGKVVHTWRMPYPPGLYGYLTEKGTLFYNGKIPNETSEHRGQDHAAIDCR